MPNSRRAQWDGKPQARFRFCSRSWHWRKRIVSLPFGAMTEFTRIEVKSSSNPRPCDPTQLGIRKYPSEQQKPCKLPPDWVQGQLREEGWDLASHIANQNSSSMTRNLSFFPFLSQAVRCHHFPKLNQGLCRSVWVVERILTTKKQTWKPVHPPCNWPSVNLLMQTDSLRVDSRLATIRFWVVMGSWNSYLLLV